MNEYDAALKLLLQASTGSILRQLTGVSVARRLNIEMPQVQTSRVDLLGATIDGGLVHVELQSSNDPEMALRMAEYALRMNASLPQPFAFQYTLIDIRDLDANALLASPHIEDNLLVILMRLQDQAAAVRQILTRIATLEEPVRSAAMARFLIISGLRRLAPTIKKEAQNMPILNDIMDHEVIGPAIRQGLKQGLREGRQEGRPRL